MLIQRKALLRHLNRIYCGGLFPEVVLENRFACKAITTDHTFMVVAEGLEGAEPLPAPIGILNLDLLIRSLRVFGEDDKDDVAVVFEDNRLVLSEEKRGTLRLLTADPKTISTGMAEGTAERVVGTVDKKKGYSLPQSMVEAILKSSTLLKADTITIHRTKHKTTFSVGESASDHAEITLPRAKLPKAESKEDYDVVMAADPFTSALQQMDDFTAAEIAFTGRDSMVSVWDDKVTYYQSPQERA
mgnify:CR=1 FL=1